MASKMTLAALDFVEPGTPDSQHVAVLEAPRHLSLRHARIPAPGPGELLVKIKYVGVCGSDVETYRGARAAEFVSLPARLGHEVAGHIVALGAGVHGLAVGDLVSCRYVWGAFAEFIVCRPFNVKVLPARFPLKETSLIEILPGVLHAADLAAIDSSKTVLITGQGVSGLVLTQILALHSPKALVVTDLHERNLELARRYGATHTYRIPSADTPSMAVLSRDFPAGFDVVVPCLLDGDGMIDAVDCCALNARLVMYGCIGVCHRPFDFFKVHRRRLTIHSTEPRRDIDMRRYFDDGVRLVLDGLVNTSEMITHVIPLDEIARAFHLRDTNAEGAIHVLVDCAAADAHPAVTAAPAADR